MTKKELLVRIDSLNKMYEELSRQINSKSDRLQEVINLLLDHLKLEVKDEDYIGEENVYSKDISFPYREFLGTRKVVKTRQVLVAKEEIVPGKWYGIGLVDKLDELRKMEMPEVKPKRKYTKRKKK